LRKDIEENALYATYDEELHLDSKRPEAFLPLMLQEMLLDRAFADYIYEEMV
jgi:hypothetical protein